jgi:hypothetical protein
MKKYGHKKDLLEWKELAQYHKADHEPEEIKHKIFEECKGLMEVTRSFRIDSKPAKEHNIFLWKHSTFWSVGEGSVDYQMLYCPMKCSLKCNCQIKICRTSQYVSLEMCGTHDAESHAPEKDTSKFLKVTQISVIPLVFTLLQNRAPSFFVEIWRTVVRRSAYLHLWLSVYGAR